MGQYEVKNFINSDIIIKAILRKDILCKKLWEVGCGVFTTFYKFGKCYVFAKENLIDKGVVETNKSIDSLERDDGN